MFDLNGEVKESSTYVFFKFLTKGHFTAFLAVKWAFLGKPVQSHFNLTQGIEYEEHCQG